MLYRIENPNIAPNLNGVTSHEDHVGQWFSSNPEYVVGYLRKSTQTFGVDVKLVDGAQLLRAEVPTDRVEDFAASKHPIAENMDIESDNYLIPRDGSVAVEVIPLDEIIEDLRGRLGDYNVIKEAKNRVLARIGLRHLED